MFAAVLLTTAETPPPIDDLQRAADFVYGAD